MNQNLFYLLVLLATPFWGFGQIALENPSFEGIPRDAAVPDGWEACGVYSTPDILPGFWEVENEPVEGNSFLGLITRSDETIEFIAQMLDEPLQKSECYVFNVHLARSATYADFNLPVRLRIWGGHELCQRKQLLGQSKPITHQDWRRYEFMMIPKNNYRFLILEAYFLAGPSIAYNGNVLVDNCSIIEVCDRVLINDDNELSTNRGR